MDLTKLTFILLCLFTLSRAQDERQETAERTPTQFATTDLVVPFITGLLETPLVQSKIETIIQLFDLKVRLVSLVQSIFTPQNMILLRRALDYVIRVCNFLQSFLPEAAEEQSGILDLFLPFLSANPAPEEGHERFSRNATNLTQEDVALFEKHKDDVMHVAKLLYKTP